MTASHRANDLEAITQESQTIWDSKAAFWDEQMAEGNAFHRVLIAPAVTRLLDPQPGEQILDVACGNGQFSRQLAAAGATVVATDFSQVFLNLAQARTAPDAAITYRLVDATDEAALLALGPASFAAAVCNMGLMDMPTITPLLRALAQLLRPGGRFVFSVQHPCFNNNSLVMTWEEGERDGTLVRTRGVRLSAYLDLPPTKGVGMPGEPAPHYYFHRPLHELIGACFAAGFMLDGLAEPAFAPGNHATDPLSWGTLPQFPPVFVVRLRLVPQP